ncbi:MAG: hypothetical protein ABJO09_00560 [Hyphomicrobiales bacterium]
MKDLRLLPMLMLACCAMLALKLLGFMQMPGGTLQQFAGVTTLFAQDAEQVEGAETMQETESSDSAASDLMASETPNSELSILQSLRKRRTQLAEQEESLQLRENLIEAAEERLESRIEQLEALEARLKATTEAELGARKEELRGLVTMYETMKPKEAARIFDRLQMEVLLDVVNAMNPRKMAAVLAKMNPEAAQRLTSSLARSGRRGSQGGDSTGQLPKIGG